MPGFSGADHAVVADEPKQLDVPSFAVHSTRGLIRDRKMRRAIMGVTLVVAVVLLICSAVVNVREHFLLAVICWLATAWIAVLASLLALYDLLAVRREARAERDRLRRELE